MRKSQDLVRHHSDRKGHQWDAVNTASTILTEEISGPTVILRVLIGDEFVEELDNLVTRLLKVRDRHVEYKIVPTDMPDEALWGEPPHQITEHLRDQQDDAVTVVVTIAVIELFEVVQVGITNGESFFSTHPFEHVAFDLDRARESSGRVDAHVTVSAPQEKL